jgi:hypothetical protein
MDLNNHPLNKAAWKWLREAKQTPDRYSLHLLELAAWGLEHGGQGDWPARDRPAVELQVGYLCAWKPQDILIWLLSNPNGPETAAEQADDLLVALRHASSPESAAGMVLNAIYARQQAQLPALQPAASELR